MAGTGTGRVDPANAEQSRAWNDDEGPYWVEHADDFDRAISEHHGRLLAAAAIEPAEHVLDIGCGNGQTTRDAARAARAGRALGVDLSAPMLDYARRRAAAEGVTNVAFEQADAQIHAFEKQAYDLVLSRAGAMFFADPVV